MNKEEKIIHELREARRELKYDNDIAELKEKIEMFIDVDYDDLQEMLWYDIPAELDTSKATLENDLAISKDWVEEIKRVSEIKKEIFKKIYNECVGVN